LALNEEMIDDMNDGDRLIPQVNGRAGAWKDQGDATSSSTMFPDPAGLFTMTNTGDACRKYAAYVYGGPFVDGTPEFYFGIGGPYDASKYDGISFWGKIDSGSSSAVRVAFPDKDTQLEGGLCQMSVAGNTCWDHYAKKIDLTTTWTKWQISFNELAQYGWGRAGAGFDRSTIYEVQFQLPVNAKFGVWVDDVALVIGSSN
jgi:Carbohydrate binding domain (family 11).